MSESSLTNDLADWQERGRQGGLTYNLTASRELLVRVERLTELDLAEVGDAPARKAFVSGYLAGIRERIAAAKD